MFGNEERDRKIERVRDTVYEVSCMANRNLFDNAELLNRHVSLVRDVGENEKAIALILQHLGLEYRIVPKHPELVLIEKPETTGPE